jgi:hypothetical protein
MGKFNRLSCQSLLTLQAFLLRCSAFPSYSRRKTFIASTLRTVMMSSRFPFFLSLSPISNSPSVSTPPDAPALLNTRYQHFTPGRPAPSSCSSCQERTTNAINPKSVASVPLLSLTWTLDMISYCRQHCTVTNSTISVTEKGFQPTLPGEYTKISSALALFRVSRTLSKVLEQNYPAAAAHDLSLHSLTTLENELDEWSENLPVHLKLTFVQDKPSTDVTGSRSALLVRLLFAILCN